MDNNQISLDEVYKIIGQKDILIFKLEQEVARLRERISHLEIIANGKEQEHG